MMFSIDQVNSLSDADFVSAFGGAAEHSPWVAAAASLARPYGTRDAMIEAFRDAVFQADRDRQISLIRAHPDLAGKAAMAGDLTVQSTSEQSGAGLDSLSASEFELFSTYNAAYLSKYKFPFILAVKGASKQTILESFADRLAHNVETEFQTALEQISKIIRFRLEDNIHE